MTPAVFLTHLDTMLDLPEGTITGAELLNDIPEWDSLAVISFIALVDEQFDQIVEGEKLAKAESVGDLLALVKEHIDA